MINVNRIVDRTRVEGPGERCCIWLQGCSRHCKGCFATETWSHRDNKLFSVNELYQRLKNNKNIEGVTILGGEPFEQAAELAQLIKKLRPSFSIIVFTGYKLKDLIKMECDEVNTILNHIDVLIDGAYVEEKRDFSVPMIGSSNQVFHFLTDYYQMSDFPENKIEARVLPNGEVEFNGMGDFRKLKKKLGEDLKYEL